MIKTFDSASYIICHGPDGAIHFSKVDSGMTVHTDQPNVEDFDNEEDWKARIQELGGDISSLTPADPSSTRVGRAIGRRREEKLGNSEQTLPPLPEPTTTKKSTKRKSTSASKPQGGSVANPDTPPEAE